MVLAVLAVDFESKMILAGPDILSRGFIYMRESGGRSRHLFVLFALPLRINAGAQSVSGAIVNALRPFLYKH